MSCCGTALPVSAGGQTKPVGSHASSHAAARQVSSFMVPAMHCAGCIRKIESALGNLPYVHNARANLSTRQVEVIWSGDGDVPERIAGIISGLGFDNHLIEAETDTDDALRRKARHLLLCLAVAGFASANIMLLSVSVWSGADAQTTRLFNLISGLIAVPAVFFAGTPFFSSARSALGARQLNMDVPISLAVLLSLFMSLYEALKGGGETFFEAGVMLLFFLLIGRTLDHLMRQKAASGVRSLARLIPASANRVLPDGNVERLELASVTVGMVLRLLPGDRFPVDARVVGGTSTADRSVVTGEADDVPVSRGDVLEAGTLNLDQVIDVEALSDARTSFLAEVMEMMKAAETSKGRYRRIADRMAAIYAPAVHLLALATFVGWLVLTGEVKPSLVAAVAVLIITCPCALGLAVPVSHVVAANRLFRQGIMLRDGSALERMAEVDTVYFDKTGTLTDDGFTLRNRPELASDHASVLTALAAQSRHPAARAIAAAYPGVVNVALQHVKEHVGLGIEANWQGKVVRLGRAEWANQIGDVETANREASTVFAIAGEAAIGFHMKGDLRPGAIEAISTIRDLGLQTAILSGDNTANVNEIAQVTGIRNWFSSLLPKDKIDMIRRAAPDHKVLMVGDGLNDAPCLAAAHVSMTPASAIDVSRASADFVFTRPSLMGVPFAIRMARAANRVVRQNFGLAIAYNCIAVPLAVCGYISPLVAAIAMSLSSIVVVANSMRLAIFDRAFWFNQRRAMADKSRVSAVPSISEVKS